MASVGQPQSHNNTHRSSSQEQDCKISSSNHLNSASVHHGENLSVADDNAGSLNPLQCANNGAEGIDNGVVAAASSNDSNGYPDNGFSSSNNAADDQPNSFQRHGSRNPSGGNNNSESSISSSTNPSSVGGAGESDVEASGESTGVVHYRPSCVVPEDDAGSSSHSEVRSSSPGLADADADVEDSPSGSEETGSESERGGSSLAGNGSSSVMYAPNTVGFPPTRSSWSHSIPAGGSFGTGTKFSTGTNPFAVKGVTAGSVSSTSVPAVSNQRILTSSNTSASTCSGGGIASGGLGGNFGNSSASVSAVSAGRWGTCTPQPLKPASWNSRPIIRPSALGSSLGGSGVSSSTTSPLTPSALGSYSPTNPFSLGGSADSAGQVTSENNTTTTSGSSFPLRPSKLSSPFGLSGARAETTQLSDEAASRGSPEPSSSTTSLAAVSERKASELMFVPLKKGISGTESISTGDSVSVLSSSSSSAAGATSTTFTSATIASSSSASSGVPSFSSVVSQSTDADSNFVFGSNLRERVSADKGDRRESVSNGISSSTCEGGLFSEALKNVQPTLAATPSTSASALGQDGCLETGSPAFGDDSHSERKRRFDDTPVITGEEDEFNVLQITCRLFAFDSNNCSWVERGRGQLRLNDRSEVNNDLQSRVIVRTKGSLRLMLNTNLWAGMKVDRASSKSIRFTANDNGQIRLFLVMATVGEVDQLYQALDWRVKNLKAVEEKSGGGMEGGSAADDSCETGGMDESAVRMDRRRSSHHSLKNNETGKASSSDEESNSDDDKDDDELRTLPPKKKRYSEVDSVVVASVTGAADGRNDTTSPANSSFVGSRPTPPTIRINNHEMRDEEDLH